MKIFQTLLLSLVFATAVVCVNGQQDSVSESDYYKIITLPVPDDLPAEVGGLTTLPDGRIAFCTRRGDVWIVENPTMEGGNPHYSLFASGLHEPLGLAYRDNSLYAAQRGELTKLSDMDGDGKADVYKTIYAWPLSGHYHEYSYGPKFAPDGSMFVTANVAFGEEEWWRGESRVPWRGWAMHIQEDGTMEPWAAGFRSPCGLGMIDGEFFYADNQGDWFGSGGIWRVKKGSFLGHPASLRWTGLPGSPIKLTSAAFLAKVHDEREFKDGKYVKPENDSTDKNPQILYQFKDDFPELQLPAVWLPHAILGISNSEMLKDETKGKFGPFEGQIFIGDQGQSKIMRVMLEKVKGEYQGAAFDFASNFQSGILRMTFGHDGSLFLGETNRGWGSAGEASSGLQRLVWTGKTPMEIQTVHAMPDGFELTFTMPVDRKTAEDPQRYTGRSFIYKYHSVYGSPTINEEPLKIRGIRLSDDGMKVRLVIDNLRQYYLHEITVSGVLAEDKTPILHPVFYYTLNNIPEGTKLSDKELRLTPPPAKVPKKSQASPAKASLGSSSGIKLISNTEAKTLLTKNTCVACHNASKRQVGPSFTEIANRGYSVDKIVQLIYNPKAQNWPGYSTEMPPMTQVPRDEAIKIAGWINSLRNSNLSAK